MMLRNVVSRALSPLGDTTGYETRLLLDCGHTERRNGDMLHLKRVLCPRCAARVNERTARQLERGGA